jgi:hypothetical protein
VLSKSIKRVRLGEDPSKGIVEAANGRAGFAGVSMGNDPVFKVEDKLPGWTSPGFLKLR